MNLYTMMKVSLGQLSEHLKQAEVGIGIYRLKLISVECNSVVNWLIIPWKPRSFHSYFFNL